MLQPTRSGASGLTGLRGLPDFRAMEVLHSCTAPPRKPSPTRAIVRGPRPTHRKGGAGMARGARTRAIAAPARRAREPFEFEGTPNFHSSCSLVARRRSQLRPAGVVRGQRSDVSHCDASFAAQATRAKSGARYALRVFSSVRAPKSGPRASRLFSAIRSPSDHATDCRQFLTAKTPHFVLATSRASGSRARSSRRRTQRPAHVGIRNRVCPVRDAAGASRKFPAPGKSRSAGAPCPCCPSRG